MVRARKLYEKAIIIAVSFVDVFIFCANPSNINPLRFKHNNITVDPDETDHNDSTCVIFLL